MNVVVVEPVGKRVVADVRGGRARVERRKPARGEVWVFQSDYGVERGHVKRVIGVGGDTLMVRDGVLYVNGTIYQLVSDICSECGVISLRSPVSTR